MRLIDADALIEIITARMGYQLEHAKNRPYVDCARDMMKLVKHAPTIDAVPVAHGKLIYKGIDWDYVHVGDTWECSKCHKVWFSDSGCDILYCSNCGAKLDEVSE